MNPTTHQFYSYQTPITPNEQLKYKFFSNASAKDVQLNETQKALEAISALYATEKSQNQQLSQQVMQMMQYIDMQEKRIKNIMNRLEHIPKKEDVPVYKPKHVL